MNTSPWASIPSFVLIYFLLQASWSDLKYRRVSNALNLSLLFIGLLLSIVLGNWSGLSVSLLGVLTSFSMLILPFALRLYRGGDVKLCMALGAWLGPQGAAWSIAYGVALGGALGLLYLLVMRQNQRTFVKNQLKVAILTQTLPTLSEETPTDSPTIPMAIAFSLGALSVWCYGPVTSVLK